MRNDPRAVTHAPPSYDCPMCAIVRDGGNDLIEPEDVVTSAPGALEPSQG